MSGDAACFLPNSVLTLIKAKNEFITFEGSVLFADVAGFTPLTESLLILGKEGSEELTRIVNNYFSEMINIVYNFGGDVLRFAGDAMTILFENDKGEIALSSGLEMLEKMEKFRRIKTRAGEFNLEMKIGCSFGKVLIGLLDDGKEMDYYAIGEPLDLSAEAEHHAQRGEIIAEKNILVPDFLSKSLVGENFFKIQGVPIENKKQKNIDTSSNLSSILSKSLPQHLIEMSATKSIGQHRGVSVLFLSFYLVKGKEEEVHLEICNFYMQLKTIANKYGGIVNKLDFGDKGSKALILFGTPYSVEKREIMALRCAIDIKENLGNKWQIKVGLTSSHLFSALLGCEKRREFSVMGDGINLAARLMAYCIKENVPILVDETTFKASRNEISFKEKGKIQVKGKSGLISIFEPVAIIEEGVKKEEKKLYGFEQIQNELVEWIKKDERNSILITSDIGGGKSSLANYLYNQAMLREYQCIKIDLQIFSKETSFSLFTRFFKKIFKIKSKLDIDKLAPLIDSNLQNFIKLLYPYFNFEEDKTYETNLLPKEKREIVFSIFLSLLQKEKNYILVIDNLSFADEASLDFLNNLLSLPEKKPIYVIAFSRKEILEKPISNLFEKKIELKPLNTKNIRTLLKEEFGLRDLNDKVLDFFGDKSKGNPQLLLAIYETLKNEGLIQEKNGIRFIDEERLFKTKFPDSLEAIYLKEFDKLSNKEKNFLFTASVLGMNVSVNLLSKISQLSETEIDEVALKLQRKNLIKIDFSGKRKYLQFADTLLYEAIYNLAPFSFRRETHSKVFKEIYKIEGKSKPSVFPYLAYHSERAEEKENAIKFHRLSAKMLLNRYDNTSALKHFEYVLNNTEVSEEYFEDTFKLLDIYLLLGKFEEFKQSLSSLEKFISVMSEKMIASFFNKISELDIREGKVEEAEKNLIKSLELSNKSKDIYGKARALLNLVGRVYGPSGRYEEGMKFLKEILSLPHFEGDAIFRVTALMNLGLILRHLGNFKEAYLYYKKALNLSKKYGLFFKEPFILNNLSQLSYETSKFKKSVDFAKKALEISNATTQKELTLEILNSYSLSLWANGEMKKAIELSSATLEKSKLYHKPYSEALAYIYSSISQFEELQFLESFENIKKSIDLLQSISCPSECYSSKLEYLRFLEFIKDYNSFKKYLSEWGGREKIIQESKNYSLPESLISILYPMETLNKSVSQMTERNIFDFDIAFIYFLRTKDKDFLKHLILPSSLRYDLKVKFVWAYLKVDLKPKYPPLQLLSKSKGGIYGLRILSILYKKYSDKRNWSSARKIRKQLLDGLYVAKIHSDDNIWQSIIKDEDIKFALKGL